ncbi:MAG: phosphoribosyl-ATP diphosphatase [Sphingomonadales bacterium]|jgi:phosphoribosyl-ATP pyrophosphohydrolase
MSDSQLDALYTLIEGRKSADSKSSYVASLFAKGPEKIAEKLGEEAIETVIAALRQGKDETISESADLIFHLMVLWAELGIRPEDVWAELARREGVSGLVEKANRSTD